MGSETFLVLVLVVGVIIFLFFNRQLISDAFASGANAINDTVTGTHVVTSKNQTQGQVIGQRVISDVGGGQPAISGEANKTLDFFPHAIKGGSSDPLTQMFDQEAQKLGRPLTESETRALIKKFNDQNEKDFLSLGGFVQK